MIAKLHSGLAQGILNAAFDCGPKECCGLLLGVFEPDNNAEVFAILPATNLATNDNAFFINPAEHIAAQREARSRGLSLIGSYHSHPSGDLRPSALDHYYLTSDPMIWIIAACNRTVNGDNLKAYFADEKGFSAIDWIEAGAA